MYGDEHPMSPFDADRTSRRLSFRDRPVTPAFGVRIIDVPPGAALPYVAADWTDALVVIEEGELVLEGIAESCRLTAGAVFTLGGMALQAVRNPGVVPTVLSAVRRQVPR